MNEKIALVLKHFTQTFHYSILFHFKKRSPFIKNLSMTIPEAVKSRFLIAASFNSLVLILL